MDKIRKTILIHQNCQNLNFFFLPIYGQIDLKMAIVHCAWRKLENHQVLSFQSGFRDLENDRIWCCSFFSNRTNSKQEKTGFRASPLHVYSKQVASCYLIWVWVHSHTTSHLQLGYNFCKHFKTANPTSNGTPFAAHCSLPQLVPQLMHCKIKKKTYFENWFIPPTLHKEVLSLCRVGFFSLGGHPVMWFHKYYACHYHQHSRSRSLKRLMALC